MKRITLLLCAVLLALQGYTQAMTRDGFIEILGKKVEEPTVQQFLQSYDVKSTDGGKYASAKNGIDIDTKNDRVSHVNVYKSSPVYGSYGGKLSMGLKFGMIPPQVADKLGKPTTVYKNAGYSEYVFAGYMITCWFEQGVLSQVSLSPK